MTLISDNVPYIKDLHNNRAIIKVDDGGCLIMSDLQEQRALGNINGQQFYSVIGRNPAVSTGTYEDLWNGSTAYTGHNPTANQNIAVASASTSDTGTLVASGTATGGSNTTLINTGTNFVTAGVVVGDLLINDTQAVHSIITGVTATTLTVYKMRDDVAASYINTSGNSYRIARAASTGAGVIKIKNIYNIAGQAQADKYVIMNGTTTVTVTSSCARLNRAYVVIAGSNGTNAGVITIRQATTTANIFAEMPTLGTTVIGCGTVPASKRLVGHELFFSLTRAAGLDCSAEVYMYARNRGEIFRPVYGSGITNSSAIAIDAHDIILTELTDFKLSINNASANLVAQGEFTYTLMDM